MTIYLFYLSGEDCESRLLYGVWFEYQALILFGIQYPKGLVKALENLNRFKHSKE